MIISVFFVNKNHYYTIFSVLYACNVLRRFFWWRGRDFKFLFRSLKVKVSWEKILVDFVSIVWCVYRNVELEHEVEVEDSKLGSNPTKILIRFTIIIAFLVKDNFFKCKLYILNGSFKYYIIWWEENNLVFCLVWRILCWKFSRIPSQVSGSKKTKVLLYVIF